MRKSRRLLVPGVVAGLLMSFFAAVTGPVHVALAAACAPSSATVAGDTVLTFTNTTACQWTVPANATTARILLIGGGGGGGYDIGGGGGGGGFREVTNAVLTPGETVNVTAGAGGSGDLTSGSPCVASSGSSSTITLGSGTLTAIGGGGAGGQDGGGNCATDGLSGASGGGGGVGLSWPRVGGAGTYATDGDPTTFGNAGGNTPTSGGYYAGGGGGGAGAAGGNGSSDGNGAIGGAGGAGKTSNITGSNVAYAGGGAGGYFQGGTRGLGGTGGGGNGGTDGLNPTSGANGFGGGGGGGGNGGCGCSPGGNGGSGVVIVRFSTVAPTTTTTTSTTTTTTTSTTTTTLPPVATTTTAAPTLQIIINNPVSTVAPSQTTSPGTVTVPGAATASTVASPLTTTATLRSASGGFVTTTVPASTTTVPAFSTTTTVPPPQPATVTVGEAAVSVGDQQQTATISRAANQLVISAGSMTATVGAVDENGVTQPLDADGNIALEPGDRVAIKMAGFPAGTDVEMWMFSTPVRIGTAHVNAQGQVDTVVSIPKDAPNGTHRIVIATKGDNPVKFTLGIAVRNYTKESNIATWLIVIPIVVAVLSALFLPPALRRRRKVV